MKRDNSNIELTKMVNKLIDIIGREIKLLETYLELLDRQQELAVLDDQDNLRQVNADQLEKLNESRLLNRERIELVMQIRQANEFEKDPNVDRLIDLIERERADRLLKLGEIFENLNNKIEETRNSNNHLVERSRQYIMKTLDMLSRIYCPETFGAGHDGIKVNNNTTTQAVVTIEI